MAHTTTAEDDEPGPRTLETPSTLAAQQGGGGPSPTNAPLHLHHHAPISSSSTLAGDDDAHHNPQDVSVAVNGPAAVSAAVGGAPQLPPTSTPALLPPTLTPTTTLAVLSTLPPSAPQLPPRDLAAASASSIPSTTTTLTNVLPPTQSAALRALNAPAFQSSLRPRSSHPQSKSKSAKSTSSRTTLSSQPVVVRTYSGSRHKSHHSTSAIPSPRYLNMNRPSTSHHPNGNPSALSAGLADARQQPKLPAVESFSFSAILRAVDPEIRDAIDAIAEICARSRYSLADEYDAHLPPQGEITIGGVREMEASRAGHGPGRTASSSSSRGRLARIGQGWSAATAERTLVSVPEASSSSERSVAGEGSRRSSLAGNKGRSQSAYGSLKSVISGGSGSIILNKRRKSTGTNLDGLGSPTAPKPFSLSQPKHHTVAPFTPTWSIVSSLHLPTQKRTMTSSSHQPHRAAITITTSPRASHQLSLDTSSTIKNVLPSAEHEQASQVQKTLQNGHAVPRPPTAGQATTAPWKGHARNASGGGGALAALASWVPMWTGRLTRGDGGDRANNGSGELERGRGEDLMLGQVKQRLRGMLKGEGAT